MYSRSGLYINRLCKNVTKTSNFCTKSSQQNSTIIARGFHEISCGITAKKIRESNLACTDLFTNCKSVQTDSNKFLGQIKPELLHSNLESSPSTRCNKLMKDSDEMRYKTRQLMHKSSFSESFSKRYRLSCLREPFNPDYIESELFDFQHILDPYNRMKISRDLIKKQEQKMEKEKIIHDTSGPIIWNIIF